MNQHISTIRNFKRRRFYKNDESFKRSSTEENVKSCSLKRKAQVWEIQEYQFVQSYHRKSVYDTTKTQVKKKIVVVWHGDFYKTEATLMHKESPI